MFSALIGSVDLVHGGSRFYYEQVEIHKDYNFLYENIDNNIGLITVLILKVI